MNELNEVPIKFQKALNEYLLVYFTERNYSRLDNLLSHNFVAFGTGRDEHVYTKSEALRIFKRDLETAPKPIRYSFIKKTFRPLNEYTAIFQGELKTETKILGEYFSFNHLRLTLVFHQEGEAVKLVAKHISLPTTEHEEGESYPLKELEEQRKIKQQGIEIRF